MDKFPSFIYWMHIIKSINKKQQMQIERCPLNKSQKRTAVHELVYLSHWLSSWAWLTGILLPLLSDRHLLHFLEHWHSLKCFGRLCRYCQLLWQPYLSTNRQAAWTQSGLIQTKSAFMSWEDHEVSNAGWCVCMKRLREETWQINTHSQYHEKSMKLIAHTTEDMFLALSQIGLCAEWIKEWWCMSTN